jgi:hypothetical protein
MGKYKGVPLKEVPPSILLFGYEFSGQAFGKKLREYVKRNYAAIKKRQLGIKK